MPVSLCGFVNNFIKRTKIENIDWIYFGRAQSSNSCSINEMIIFMFMKHLFCRLLIIVGVILLVGSTRIVRSLPCSLQRKRSNAEKNYGPRRSTSSRVREPSPSAVIQAATLNHLLSSSSKEKAWLDLRAGKCPFILFTGFLSIKLLPNPICYC